MRQVSIILVGLMLTGFFLRSTTFAHAAATCPATISVPCVNVMAMGASGNGVNNDTDVINNAEASLPDSGGTIYFPPGTYAVGDNGIILKKSHIIFQGDNNTTSIIKRVSGTSPIIQPSSPGYSDISIKNLKFDSYSATNGNYTIIADAAQISGPFTVDNCFFANSPDFSIYLNGIQNVSITNSTFYSPGLAQGGGIRIQGNAKHVTIANNKFLFLNSGIIIGNASDPQDNAASDITIANNYFDLGWYLLKSQYSGEGNTVTYTQTSLTDTAASFPTNPGFDDGQLGSMTRNVVALPVRQTGSGTYTATTLTDRSARFVKQGLLPGDLVRTNDGSAFGVVSQVKSDRSVTVEQWLSRSTYLPVAPPPAGTAYTAYGVIVGSIWNRTGGPANDAHTIYLPPVLYGWTDMSGRNVVPPNGSRYEILVPHPVYPLNLNNGTYDVTVSGNTILRGWGDQLSSYSDKQATEACQQPATNDRIVNNTVMSGQDMGIFIQGGVNDVISGNKVMHEGSGGIVTSGDYVTMTHNTVIDVEWINPCDANTPDCSGITLYGSSFSRVVQNTVTRRNAAMQLTGITLWNRNPSFPTTGNVIAGNTSTKHSIADIYVYQPASSSGLVSDTILQSNIRTVVDDGSGTVVLPSTQALPTTSQFSTCG